MIFAFGPCVYASAASALRRLSQAAGSVGPLSTPAACHMAARHACTPSVHRTWTFSGGQADGRVARKGSGEDSRGKTERDPLRSIRTRGSRVETAWQMHLSAGLALAGSGCRHRGLPGKDTEYPASVHSAYVMHTVNRNQSPELVPAPWQPMSPVGAQSYGTGLLFK